MRAHHAVRWRLNREREAALLFAVFALGIGLTLAAVDRWQPPDAPAALAPTIPAANIAVRTANLDRLMRDIYAGGGDPNRARSWYPHITTYQLAGDNLTVETDYAPGSIASDALADIATTFLRDMHTYGDPVTLVVIKDAAGGQLLAVPWKFA